METTTEPPPSVLQIASMFASLSRQHHQNVRSRGAADGGRRIISENSTETFRTVNSNAASSTTSVVYFSNRGGNNNGSIRTRSRSSDSRPTRLDLKMIDNRSKFNEVKALFENLERQSRQEQKQRTPHNNKKRVASPSPTRSCGIRNEQYTDEPKAPGRTVAPFSNTTKSILPNTSAPPVPPKPKVAESPTSTTEIRRPVFQRSWTTDSSSTTVQQNGGDGDYLQVGTRGRSLEKEVTDKGDTKMADTTDEMDGPQKSSIYSYEPYWRSNRYARQRLANGDVPVSERPQSPPNSQVNPKRNYTLKTDSLDNNSVGSDTSATLVQQKNDPGRLDITWPPPTATATAQTPMTIVRSPTEENKDSGVVTDSPSTSTTDSRASSSANALPPNTSFSNSTATVEDWTKSCLGTQTTKTDEEQSNVALMTKEEASVLLSPSTRDVVLRENPGRTNGEAGGEIRSLPSHLSIPQDVDHKRHSMCSMDSTSEQGGTASDRYSMLDDGNVNVLPDGHFWIEVPGLLDPSPPPSPTDTLTFKKPSRVKFSNAPIKVYSTYTGLEYDRRNDDIDPVSASAEFELERRLEKMDVIEVELQKGPEGLGFSIIGMGVGADAGLEKLGIFVKSITPGGAVHRDGRILVCDQIVEVDGQSLVGVSQNYAASVLRSTSGTVRFKIGREKDLDNSEIAALIRQSLEQDRIMREQEELFQRRLSAGNGNEDGEMREMEKSKFGGISDQDNSSGWIHRTTHQSPLPSTDSVFTHDNEEETEEHVVGSDQHLERLMAQLRQPFKSQNTNQQQQKQENPVESIKTVSLINIEQKSKESEDQDKSTLSPAYSDNIKSLAFRSDLQRENVIDEFPPAYTPPESISRLANYSVQMDEMERRFASNETGSDVLYHATVQPCFDTWPSTKTAIPTSVSPEFGQLRRSTPDLTSSTDSMNGSEIQTKINTLEAELSHIRDETDKYQTLLNESKVQFDTLEKKYDRAQKLIKNYQNREKDLLNREELHLRELCEKDQQYANLVKMLKEKVIGLEKQLQDAHRKRASIVDPQSTTGLGKNTNQSGSDISPALAYQPAKKLGPICDEKYAMDVGKKESATCTKMAPTIGTAHIVPIIRHSSAVLPEFIGAKVIDSKRHASTDLGVPTTELLDSKAAKCKVEAVKQSQVMSARALPTRRPETEVFIMCHHTMENAQTLRAHATGGHCGAGDSDHADQSGQLVSCSTDSTSKSISLTSNNGSPLTPRRLAQRAAMLLRKKTSTTLSHLDRSSASVIVGSGDPGKVPAVLTWTCDDVCRFLKSNGLEKYTPEFSINRVDGCKLLQLDGSRLKAMGVQNHSDRSLIKKQIKEMKAQIERERKQLEKESRRLLKLEKDKKNQPSKS